MEEIKENKRFETKNLPEKSGCYMFKDEKGEIIYIGKAKNIKKRVESYFNRKDLDIKTASLVSKIKDIDFLLTDNEIEALVLENNLIKKHKPKYNINLRDSRRYAYIIKTNEEYPRFLISRERKNEKGKIFGPFTSAEKRDYILKTIIETFKIRTCKRLPKKECIRYQIGLCYAPCTKKISRREYLELVKSAEMVLKGKIEQISKSLYSQMIIESSKQNFEKALEIKKQIESLKALNERQKAERQKSYDEDIINFLVWQEKAYLMIFSSVRGVLEGRLTFEIDYSEDFFEEFLTRYYSENNIPNIIIIPVDVSSSIEGYLSKLAKKNVKIINPKKGEKKELLELVRRNIEEKILKGAYRLESLASRLNLNELPRIIECFDVSHFSGDFAVASMVKFNLGVPEKSSYRRFKIKSVKGIDDYASIREVVRRRYTRLLNENANLPNLIIIDGGKGQLNSAFEELKNLGLKIPIISISKKNEEIWTLNSNEPIVLDKKDAALKLVQEIRDEAHRFAISYNKLLLSKRFKEKGFKSKIAKF